MELRKLDYKMIMDELKNAVDETVLSWADVPAPETMHGIIDAVNLFAWHVNQGHRILCVHDSDCDGINTYMLGYIFFKKFNFEI